MNRFPLTFVVVLAASCGKHAPEGTPCTTQEVGTTRCYGTKLQVCQNGVWTQQKDCASTSGLTCRAAGGVVAACGAPAVEGEACRDQVECAEGLTCSVLAFHTEGMCLALCDPTSATSCTSGEVCAALTSDTGICGGLESAGNACIDDVQCPADAPACHWFRQDQMGAYNVPLGACAQSCPESEIGQGQGSCPAGLDCLESPFRIEPQSTSGNAAVPCTSDGDCDTANGFICLSLVQGQYCARTSGVCGYALPLYSELPADVGSIPPSDRCAAPFQAGEAELRYFCGVTDPSATVRPFCIPVFSPDAFEGVCVATCTTAAECGAGYDCQTPPAATAIAWETQKDTFGNDVTCIKSGSNTCAATYTCETLVLASGTADYCGRPSAVCVKL